MKARAVIVVLAITALLSCRRHAAPDVDVLLITIDTLRADALGFAGNTRVRTPYLDSLAARGIVFANAHAHNVVTLPSHANILTGLYPYEHGLRDNAGFTLDTSHPTLGAMLKKGGYATAAFVSAFPLDSRFGLNAGFDVYDDKYREASNPLDFVVQERPAEETLKAAKAWIEATEAKKFVWIHLYDPHAPYDPPPPFREQYRDAPYLGEVAYVDDQLSRFLPPILEKHPNTIVVITGDHGEALGDHGEQTHGLFAYESTLKIPLLVIDPEQKARREARYVRHVDIVPTLLQRAGVEPATKLPGHDLLAGPANEDSYFESLSASLNRGWAPLVGMIHDERKYIDLPLPELYDLAHDPKEGQNLAEADRRDLFAIRKLLAGAAPNAQSAERKVDDAQKAQLMSLGYISGTASVKKSYTAADDPKNLVAVDNELHDVVALYQTAQLPKAIELLRAILKKHPGIKVADEMLAFMLQQSENPQAAIEMLRRAVQSGAANDAMKVRLGMLLSSTGQAGEALQFLQPFASSHDPDILNAYGIALADSGDLRGATAVFDRVLTLDHTNATAYQNLGVVALRAGDVEGARTSLAKALALNDRMPAALNLMGVLEAKNGRADQAIDWWRRAVRADPHLYDSLYNMAVVAARAGRNDVAREALRQFIATAPPQRYADDLTTARALLAQLR